MIMPIRDNQSPSKSSSHSFQDQVKTESGPKEFPIFHFPSFWSSSLSHNSGIPNFPRAFSVVNWFGCRCRFKALVQLSTFHAISSSHLFSCWLRATFPRSIKGSRCHPKTALPEDSTPIISCLAVASRQQSWSISHLQPTLLVSLVNCSFAGVLSDTLECSPT